VATSAKWSFIQISPTNLEGNDTANAMNVKTRLETNARFLICGNVTKKKFNDERKGNTRKDISCHIAIINA
jgi:hypothetical protein